MVRKNEYTLNKKVNESVLKKCGFRKEHGDCYTLIMMKNVVKVTKIQKRAWRLLYIKTFPV